MASQEVIEGNLLIELDPDYGGVFWAIRDQRQMQLLAADYGVFEGETVIDPLDKQRSGVAYKATDVKGKPYVEGYLGGISYTTIVWNDGTEEERLSSQLLVPRWPRKASVRLETSDYLTVYGEIEPATVVWEGFVKFIKQLQPRDTPKLREKMAEQADVDMDVWASWFRRQLPARLEQPGKNLAS